MRSLSDRTRTRWGARKPYLVLGSIVSTLTFVALFTSPVPPSPFLATMWICFLYTLLATGDSIYSVPYLTLAAEIGDTPAQRTTALAFKQCFCLVGVMAGLALAPWLVARFGGGRSGYAIMAQLLGIGLLVTTMATAVFGPAGRPAVFVPAVRPAMAMFEQGPLSARAAIARLRKRAEDDVLDQLLRSGELHQIQLSSHRLRRNSYTWPLHDRVRVDQIRADALAALFGHHRPDAVTAAVIALLHRTGSLGAVLNLNDDGARHAAQSAEPIASGRWADGSTTGEVNLAVTAAAVLPALV